MPYFQGLLCIPFNDLLPRQLGLRTNQIFPQCNKARTSFRIFPMPG